MPAKGLALTDAGFSLSTGVEAGAGRAYTLYTGVLVVVAQVEFESKM
jgi:hypothetical protein